MTTLARGALIPNWNFTDVEGKRWDAWDFRQKASLILLVADATTLSQVPDWQKTVEAERKQWIWLQADVKIVPAPPVDLPPGAHAIDRYGRYIRFWESGQWTAEDIQREYVYYEARHC